MPNCLADVSDWIGYAVVVVVVVTFETDLGLYADHPSYIRSRLSRLYRKIGANRREVLIVYAMIILYRRNDVGFEFFPISLSSDRLGHCNILNQYITQVICVITYFSLK